MGDGSGPRVGGILATAPKSLGFGGFTRAVDIPGYRFVQPPVSPL